MRVENRAGDNVDSNYKGLSLAQNHAILIAGLTCACFSLAASLVTLRWFLLMKRTFRHRLVLFLIVSDTFKALWYFIFPVVVLSRGVVSSSSPFCQASGFFLALGIECSDFAILFIALHSIVYIFHPPTKTGESGGLYRWRNWIYLFWLGPPLISASLAFINNRGGYSSAGTFCYLPKRPIWYRIALAWVPRYMIISTIFGMYLSVYFYVTIKFRGFSNLGDSDSDYESFTTSRHSSIHDESIGPDEEAPPEPMPITQEKRKRPGFSRGNSFRPGNEDQAEHKDPWDDMSFITFKPLHQHGPSAAGIQAADFAPRIQGDETDVSGSATLFSDPFANSDRKISNVPTLHTDSTDETGPISGSPEASRQTAKSKTTTHHPKPPKPKDPLRATRKAIRKQLRYLFIYPAVYVLMWTFPFVAQCLLYSNYYATHPIYWLSVVQTCALALQAGADCIVFSWREKPWRRIPDDSRFTWLYWSKSYRSRHSASSMSNKSSVSTGIGDRVSTAPGTPGLASGQSSRATSTHWWEAEGQKRKDSVWLGIDMSNVTNLLPGRRSTIARGMGSISVPAAVAEEQEAVPEIPSESKQEENNEKPAELEDSSHSEGQSSTKSQKTLI